MEEVTRASVTIEEISDFKATIQRNKDGDLITRVSFDTKDNPATVASLFRLRGAGLITATFTSPQLQLNMADSKGNHQAEEVIA